MKLLRFLLITKLTLFFLFSLVFSKEKITIQPEKYRIEVKRIEEKIDLDGILDEPVWKTDLPATDFVQLEPEEGVFASERTEVKVLYDKKNLYLGISCYDSSVDKIVATEMCRDAPLFYNDFVAFILDTFHDHRNGFYFAVNPLGAKLDALITDEGQNKNFDWDGVWECETHKDSLGWYAEIAIPFKSLRFNEKKSQVWGFNILRAIRRKNEFSFWTPVSRDYGVNPGMKISRFGHLEGLSGLKQERNLETKPYLLTRLERDYQEKKEDLSGDLGLDLKYGITSNLTLDLTLNTDFAQVEADQYQINLTRFSLFFPEKRDFFLEGAGIFHFGERIPEYGGPPSTILFFSRKIGLAEGEPLPILGGLKLSGKSGKNNLGFLNIQVRRKEVEDDEEVYIIPSTNFTVIRVKRDFLAKSNFGFIFLNKQVELSSSDREKIEKNPDIYLSEDYENAYNRVAGLDINFSFFKNLNLGGFLAKSLTHNLKEKDWAKSAYFQWRNDLLNFDMTLADIDNNFNSEMGFILREDIKKAEIELGYSPRPKIGFIRQSFFFFNNRYFTDQKNFLVNRNINIGVYNALENGGHLLFGVYKEFERLKVGDDFEIKDDKWIEPGDYESEGFFSELGTDRSRMFSFNLGLNGGDFYNGKLLSLNLRGFFVPSFRLSTSLFFNYNKITKLPVLNTIEAKNEKIDFETKILGARITYSFSTRLFYRGFLQYNSEDKEFSANLLLNYIYKTGSNFYLVYNELWERNGKARVKNRTILTKIAHLIDI